MDLFRPSKKILETISIDVNNSSPVYNPLIFYNILINQNVGVSSLFISSFLNSIKNCYSLSLEESSKRIGTQKLLYPYHESAKNCIAHSSNGKDLFTVGHYLGSNGICVGFYDGGDYFKDEKIKHQYENKIKITEFNKNPSIKCSNRGTERGIFPYSDIVEIDSNKGIFYYVQFKDNIIAPEGENGNSYFYYRDKNK